MEIVENKCGTNVLDGGIDKKIRDSNLELFRIITMLFIIAHHYVVNSGLLDKIYENPLAFRSIFLLLFGAWGKTGINCFVLITGYFMCKSSITMKKFAKLLAAVMFYRIIIGCIFWCTGYSEPSLKALIKLFIPIYSIGTGFTQAYLLFFLFIPFINVLVHRMTQKQHAYLLLLVSFFYVVLGTVKFMFSVTMNYVSWFVVLYLFSSYVRLYPNKLFYNTKVWRNASIITVVLSALSVVACAYLYARLRKGDVYYFVQDSNTFLAFATGFSTFMYFKNINIRYIPAVNNLASTCFGVFLIHTNGDSMRNWLWKDLLNNVGVYQEAWMPLHAIFSVLGVFIICAGLESLRVRLLEKPFFVVWDKHFAKLASRYHEIETKLCNRLGIKQ